MSQANAAANVTVSPASSMAAHDGAMAPGARTSSKAHSVPPATPPIASQSQSRMRATVITEAVTTSVWAASAKALGSCEDTRSGAP